MANQADVRVRLSAEGQAEVIAAFQKIAAEGKKSGEQAGTAYKELNKQIGEVGKTLAGGLGLVLIAEKFKEFFKTTLEGSETLTRLSKQTGLTTGLIQGFGRAARETGIDQETANNALAKFTVNVGKAGVGSKQSSAALSDLGISVRDFSRLKPDEQFALVAQKLAAIQDPARRARDEVALFSRAGVQLDQALVKVGTEGIDPFIKHLQTLGVFLDVETLASIKHSAETFKELNDTVKGVATQFLIGFTPALQTAADELVKATTSGSNGFKDLGKVIGVVLKAVLLGFVTIGKGIGAVVAIGVGTVKAEVKAAAQALTLDFVGAAKTIGGAFSDNLDIVKQFAGDVVGSAKGLFGDDAKPKAAETGAAAATAGADGATAAALAKARLGLLEARLQNELNLYKAHAVLVKESDRQAYEDGTISLTEYYARRASLINGELDKEAATLKAKRAAIASTAIDINDPTGEIHQKTELAKIDGEIQALELRRLGELAANTNEQANAQRRLYADTLKNEERLLQIAGKKTDAARLKLALDIADLDAQLRKGGVSDVDRAGAEATVAGQGNAQIDFQKAAAEGGAALAQLETERKAIENQVRDGEIFSVAAAEKIVALDRARLPALQANADAMVKLAKDTGSAEDVQKAEAYKQKIDQIAASTNTLGIQTAQLRAGIEGAIGSGINKFLTDAVSGTKTLKQSFTDMALSILGDLEKIVIKLLEEEALKAIFGSGGGGGGAGIIGAIAGAASTAAAEGGHIRGPGTSTSDSIPARLSDGEYVVKTKAVQQPGILPLLNAINGGALKGINGSTTVPKFAEGGAVAGAGANAPVIKMVNVLDPTTLGDHLATAVGEKAVLNIISRNSQRVRSAIS